MTEYSKGLVAAHADSANRVLLTCTDGVELTVVISENSGVRSSAFAFDGVPIPAGRRRFKACPGEKKFLSWIMIGPGGSSMVVRVMRGSTVVAERTPSRIPDGHSSSFDLFEIEV